MIKVLLIIIAAFALACFVFSNKVIASREENSVNKNTANVSATEWDHLYFYGLTKSPVDQVGLNQNMTQTLIGMLGVKASISTGSLIEPMYMINQKGTTPWLAMYAVLTLKQPELLKEVHEGKGAAFIPNEFVQKIFVSHVNWPQQLLAKYDIGIQGYNVFILPFLVPKGENYNLSFSQSMKAPDGSLEIFGVGKFDENRPEILLSNIQATLDFIKEHRPDVTGK